MTTQDVTPRAGSATGLYAYAFVDAGVDVPAGLTGVGRHPCPIGLASRGDLGLLVSDVDTERLTMLYDEDLSEQSELATWAQKHDGVIRAVFDRSAVLPLRFGTVLLDRTAADRLLAEQYGTALAMLARVRDRVEWGVRIRAAASDRPADATADRSSGAAYLASRRKRLDELGHRRERDRETAAAVMAELALPVADVAHRSGRESLVDTALLVDRTAEQEFFAHVARCTAEAADAGLVLEVTGPWPPYSFTRAALEVGDD